MTMRTRKGSFAGQVLAAAAELGRNAQTFTPRDLAHAMILQTAKAERKMRNALRDLYKAGKVERVKVGLYRMPSTAVNRQPEKQEIMWRIARARRVFSVNDLIEMAGVTENYAREWCQMVVRNSVAKKIADSKYQIVSNDTDMPRNETKASRLRRIRARKKQLHAALDKAQSAVLEANTALGNARKAVHDLIE